MLKVTQRDQRSEGRGGETKLASRSRFGTFDGAPLSSHLAAVDLLLWKKQRKKRLTRTEETEEGPDSDLRPARVHDQTLTTGRTDWKSGGAATATPVTNVSAGAAAGAAAAAAPSLGGSGAALPLIAKAPLPLPPPLSLSLSLSLAHVRSSSPSEAHVFER